MDIQWIGAHANNYQKTRYGNKIDKIIIHWIVGTLQSADATFANPNRVASAHYGVGGRTIHQYVKEEDTAYHAGNLTVNRQSIGIEHEGGPDIPISNETYETSGQLIAEIAKRYDIPLDREHIKGHREIKATQCPGTIDIDRLISIAKNQGGSMSEVDDLREKVAAYKIEVEAKNKQIGEYEEQVKGLIQKAKDEYARGFKEGQGATPATPSDPTSVNESEWVANGMSVKTTEGNVEKTINYARK